MTYNVILFVITFNNILLSPPIVFTYYFVFDCSPFWYTKTHPSIIEKHFIYHHIDWDLLFFFFFYFCFMIIEQLAIQVFFRSKPQVGTRKAWWLSVRLAERNKYGHCMKLTSWFIIYLHLDCIRWLIWLLSEKSEALRWMIRHFVI